jgi:cellulose synthase/poly-beta-1,6-N-acetylglucosamine synthase-like glycosyltransferase
VIYLLTVIPIMYLLVQLLQLLVLYRYRSSMQPEPEHWPVITIMVAARNEEEHIAACLQALHELDYPKEKLHILIGNDQSTDHTADIVTAFIADKPNFKLIHIQDTELPLKAKARVMAQLDPHAQGDYYLITDADVQVPASWAKGLLRRFTPETGVVSGTTMVQGTGANAKNQEIDWAYFMGLLNIISYSGVPATAVGNNMAVRATAYRQTGGYAAIRFSITEDYKLYQEICRHGWKWDNIMAPDVLAFTEAVKNRTQLLHQRKRWLSGGTELPWYWWFLFGVFGLFYICLPLLLFLNPKNALGLWFLKWTLQSLQIARIYRLLGMRTPSLPHLLRYELYLSLLTPATALFFLLPLPTNWKGRLYRGAKG